MPVEMIQSRYHFGELALEFFFPADGVESRTHDHCCAVAESGGSFKLGVALYLNRRRDDHPWYALRASPAVTPVQKCSGLSSTKSGALKKERCDLASSLNLVI
jgi:hypothetical protein